MPHPSEKIGFNSHIKGHRLQSIRRRNRGRGESTSITTIADIIPRSEEMVHIAAANIQS
ncbi:unnamed protein product [Tuwongella immobilis]|uniref:Uncharacterized protein n=1 Tax=Tuwongella immobilis TaxID=692036 RepID=A0A6C2YKT7_9BACT|nr:unnamed protein product [Tuwongella immobilis]VTS00657.1 unnamed protein product [Tuwongella immobilis]